MGWWAISLITVFRGLRSPRPVEVSVEEVKFPGSDVAALVLASIGSAVFQLLMIKLAECIYGPFRETFALVLSLIFLGIAAGSALVKFFRVTFRHVLIANIAGLIWTIGGLTAMAEFYVSRYSGASESYLSVVALKLGVLAMIMGVPALTFGATIPALIKSQGNVSKESGRLLFASSMGNAFGFLLMAFVLHPILDYGVLLIVITGISCAALITNGFKLDLRVAVTGILFLSAIFVHRRWWDEDLLYIGHTSFDSIEDLNEEREDFSFPEKFKGYADVFSILWFEDRPYFFTNGYISMALDTPWESVVGAFAAVFAPRSDDALVLGVGSGTTAGVVGLLFERTDGVEISGVVLENLFRMKEYNFDIENNSKVTIIHDDAVHFTKVSGKQYSLIVNTVTSPLYFSSAKLYTSEFFEVIDERMYPDGIYATWIDSRVGDRGGRCDSENIKRDISALRDRLHSLVLFSLALLAGPDQGAPAPAQNRGRASPARASFLGRSWHKAGVAPLWANLFTGGRSCG